jgi:hypothetical protein
LTTTVFQDSKPVTFDARLKSAVGYIPYFGLSFLPAFGRDQEGVDGVTLPFLAIGGTDDNLAQIERIEQGVRRLGARARWSRSPGSSTTSSRSFPTTSSRGRSCSSTRRCAATRRRWPSCSA